MLAGRLRTIAWPVLDRTFPSRYGSPRLQRERETGYWLETVLCSSIAAVFFAAFFVAGTMWYGSATTPIEFGFPTCKDHGTRRVSCNIWYIGSVNDKAVPAIAARVPRRKSCVSGGLKIVFKSASV